MVIINWCSWQCFGLTCNYEESWDRPVMRWNVREKSWQLIVPLLAPQDYSQKTATTVTFRWFKNHESPVRLIKIKQSLIYLISCNIQESEVFTFSAGTIWFWRHWNEDDCFQGLVKVRLKVSSTNNQLSGM